MADPEPDSGLIDRPGVSPLVGDVGVIEGDQIRSLTSSINEEILHQSITEGNEFDSTSMVYVTTTTDGTAMDSTNSVVNHNHGSLVEGMEGIGRISLVQTLAENVSYPLEPGGSLGNDSEQILANNSHAEYVPNDCGDSKANLTHISSGEMLTNEPHTQTVLNGSVDGTYVTAIISEKQNDLTMPDPITSPLAGSRDGTTVDSQFVKAESLTHDPSSMEEGMNDVDLSESVHDPQMQNEAYPHTVKTPTPQGIPLTQDILQTVLQQVKAQQLAQQAAQQLTTGTSSIPHEDNSNLNAPNNSVSVTLVAPNQQGPNAPLGSSQNPIRIIQQGNRYTPMQQLTPDQLQQIMQVVRQQHVNKTTQENGGTVIFNPVTNTKIMYRVIYPSELHKAQVPETTYKVIHPSTLSQEQQTNASHQKRAYRKRKEASAASVDVGLAGGAEDDKGGIDQSDMSKEEKEERKKHRPRTRSGRVSKPPKHMVQDYKQLHVLDWDEDYDDSDGGYSDFKNSDEEGKARKAGGEDQETEESPGLLQGLGSGKPKNYKCHSCDKSYIGQAGLARHYRLYPEHLKSESGNLMNPINRSLDGEDSSKDASISQDGNDSNSLRTLDAEHEPIVKSNGTGIDNFSEDSNTQDSLNSNGACSPIVRRGRGRGIYRGRYAHLKYNAQMRKKNKLREFAKRCSDEDLMEVLFPRLVGSISSWEFLMMKSEKGGSRPQVGVIYNEFEGLIRHVKQVCQDYLTLNNEEENQMGDLETKTIKVEDENLAAVLGLRVGTYNVEEMLPADSNSFSSLHNKLSAASISAVSAEDKANENRMFVNRFQLPVIGGEGSDFKRKFSSLSPTDLNSQSSKRQKMSNTSSAIANHHGHIITPHNAPILGVKSEAINAKTLNGSSEVRVQGSLGTVSTLSSLLIRPTIINSTTSPSSFLLSKPAKNPTATTTTTSSMYPQIIKSDNASISSSLPSSLSHSQSSISYLITTPPTHNKASTSQSSVSQLVPVVLNSSLAHQGPAAVTSTASQMVPVILSSTKSTAVVNPHHQAIMVAAPGMMGSKCIPTSAMPIVLAAPPGSQLPPGNTTMVLAGAQQQQLPHQQQHILIRQPLKQQHQQQHQHQQQQTQNASQQQKTKVILTSHPTSSTSTPKSPLSLIGPALTTSTSSQNLHRTAAQSSSSQISRFSSNPKPAEVKVSRRLFHEATASSSMSSSSLQHTSALASSSLSNGHLTASNSTSQQNNLKQDFEKEFAKGISMTNLEAHHKISTLPLTSNSTISVANIPDINDPPQFISEGVINSGGDEDVMDTSFEISASVLGSIGFSGDELVVPLNTSSSSSVLLSSTNLATAMVNEMAPSNIPLTYSKTADGTVLRNDTHVSASELSLLNGNGRGEFSEISPSSVTFKDSIITNSSPVFMTSVSDLINPPAKPSSPLMSSPSKDSLSLNTVSSVPFNLTSMDSCENLTSHMLKSDENSANIINDLDSLNFSVQTSLPSAEQLEGQSVVNILPEQLTQSYESADTLLHTSNAIVSDDLERVGEEDGQLLLPEGSSLYQTEDGMLIIESADGNRYQLASTQGFPIEAVQTLVSGNLGEVNGDGISDGTLQTDMHLQ